MQKFIFTIRAFGAFFLMAFSLVARGETVSPRHVAVYQEPERFGGWPANHGIWSWGDEILVGFCAAWFQDRSRGHAVDPGKPEEHLLARSLDGGETWALEYPAEQGKLLPRGAMLFGTPLPGVELPPLRPLQKPVDFSHPDLAMTFRMEDHRGGGQSRFYVSTDRGRSWDGPYALPLFGTPGIAARTDYVVLGPRECLLFLTAGKSDGREGRTLAVKTTDGGLHWEFLSWIGEEPETGFRIMPSTVRLGEEELLTAVRRREGNRRVIETFRSTDGGRSWSGPDFVAGAGMGNAPAMIRLRDGRLAVTYGYRAEPYGIRAKLSADGGRTWGEEIILRDDGAGWDIGYPRSVQRADGRIVTVYYFFDYQTGPERYIAATIWDPGQLTNPR